MLTLWLSKIGGTKNVERVPMDDSHVVGDPFF